MAYVERGKVWVALQDNIYRLLKGRANPTGNRACLRRASSLDLTRSVHTSGVLEEMPTASSVWLLGIDTVSFGPVVRVVVEK